ncbi:hypothetical protein [Staphylococcus equorum]|uniref:hypothetical protein n=1 Tax=Staphylococcus equorum TaxID=246432 RepID=UPI002556E6A0|nr:hypothetical protein [Staphylococcus equorum]MDK9869925.1 hypothetical protein [Staphylococcus equorum]
MIDKELKIILLDILLKRDTFKHLEDDVFSKEELSQILKLLVNGNKIYEIQDIYASDNTYLIPIPNRYYLASETIEFLNQSESLYTYNDQRYYKVHINESQSIVAIPIVEKYFDRENAILIPFEVVEA